MRSTKFKDVLWAVARKAGYSPESGNFITNQAIPIGEYINQWVGRVYSQNDWPEWTKVVQVSPNASHIVNYVNIRSPDAYKIMRVLDVYLIDPKTTRTPVSTYFTLREEGIHCGYEHGTSVWIKYIEPQPQFTAVVWRSDYRYQKDEVVYVPVLGECYKSKINNNVGHDPAGGRTPPPYLQTEEIQSLDFADPGLPAQNQILDVYVESSSGDTAIPDPMPLNDEFTLGLFDTGGSSLAAHSQHQFGTTSIEDMLDALKVMFDADALPGFTFTVDGSNRKMRIESTTTEFVVGFWNYIRSDTTFFPLKLIQVQPFSSGTSTSDVVPQQLKLTIGENEFIPGSLYTLTFTDLDGSEHSVEYQSDVFDNRDQIFNGLLLALGDSTDPVLVNVTGTIDSTEPSMTVSMIRQMGLDAPVAPPGSPYWDVVLFPDTLFNIIVRSAGAELLGEWGQNDKQTIEEQKVPMETQNAQGDFETTPVAPLTTQQRPLSRYKLY